MGANYAIVGQPDGYAKSFKEEEKLNQLLKSRPAFKSITGEKEYKQIADQAYGTGDLPQYALLKQQAEQAAAEGKTGLAQQLNDELQNQSIAGGGAQANAYSQLAMGGGLSGGARERIAASGAEDQMRQAQSARLTEMRGQMGLEAKKQAGLLDIGAKGAEARAGMQQRLLDTRASDLGSERAAAESAYQKEVDLQAAKAKAQKEQDIADEAKRKEEESGSVICTACKDTGLISYKKWVQAKAYRSQITASQYLAYKAWGVPVANAVRKHRWLGPIFKPGVRYMAGDRDFAAKLVFNICWAFTLVIEKCMITKSVKETA
jgi:hypothetical protein